MKIIFSGGGTLGPVTPLLAIKEIIQKKYSDTEFLWVGTKRGPEKEFLEKEGMRFVYLCSGKFRRYISAWNIIDIGRIVIGFFQSIRLLLKENPDVCISAGGFISVPLHWAAWLLGIPTWIHQQDVKIGLANRLMSPCAKKITTSLQALTVYFSKRKTEWIGNPVRGDVMQGDTDYAKKIFNLKPDLPVVFATGGGTGSLRVNQLIVESMEQLRGYAQVIHLSGKERPQELVSRAEKLFDYYQVHQFFTDEMKHAYAVADVVISRGGFGTLTEIATLGKPAIIIPKPGHQVENVRFLEQAHAAIFINEVTSDGLYLGRQIRTLLYDGVLRKQLAHNLQKLLPRAEDKKILEIVEKLVG